MKKITLLVIDIVAICTFAMCIYSYKDVVSTSNVYGDYEVIVVDSCEYLHGYYRLTHKGNCKFCEERRKKELEGLVIKLKENSYGNN